MNKLYDRAYQEYENYIDNLKKQSPEKIIDNAYEITIKKELLYCFEELDYKNCKELEKFRFPLETMYQEWLNNDYSFLDDLRLTISDFIYKKKSTHMKKIPYQLKDRHE